MKKFLFAMLVIVGFDALRCVQSATASKQSSATGAQSQSSAQAPSQNPTNSTTGSLAKASNEAAGKNENADENAQFKQSGSVQWMARKLHVSTDTAYLISVLLNFAIVVGFLAIISKKMLPGLLRARNESIQKQLEEARRASADANQRLRAIEAKLGELGSDIASLEKQAAAQSKEEEARMKAAAEEEKGRIVQAAEQEIAAAAGSARRDLRNYAAELAVSLAEKKIKVDSATDRELVRDFVGQLGRNGK